MIDLWRIERVGRYMKRRAAERNNPDLWRLGKSLETYVAEERVARRQHWQSLYLEVVGWARRSRS